MKLSRIAARFLACLLPAAALTVFCSCGDAVRVDVHLTYDSAADALVDAENGITYLWAPVAYEPAVVTSPYADWNDYILYGVKEWEPTVLLTEEFQGIGGLLYADTYHLPTLTEMEPDKIYVCISASCLGTVDDPDTVREAARLLEEGECTEMPEDPTLSYSLKFSSDTVPGIYYNVVYIEVGDSVTGDHYLYDRSTKRCVGIGPELFYGTLYSDESEALAGISVLDAETDAVYSFPG